MVAGDQRAELANQAVRSDENIAAASAEIVVLSQPGSGSNSDCTKAVQLVTKGEDISRTDSDRVPKFE